MKNEECQSNVLICEMGMMVLTIMKVVVTLNKIMFLKCTIAMNSELAFLPMFSYGYNYIFHFM